MVLFVVFRDRLILAWWTLFVFLRCWPVPRTPLLDLSTNQVLVLFVCFGTTSK